jgi:ATP-grasp domain/L-amino acid ligase C-terminal domain 2
MESKLVIFVGSLSNKYIDAFVAEGYQVAFFRDINDSDIDKFLPNYLHRLSFVQTINFKNKATIADSLKNSHFNDKTILICVREKHYFVTAIIAQALKLKQSQFLDVKQAQYLTNKYFQRNMMAKAYPEIVPNYKKIRTFHGAYLFSRKHGFPVIVKPANLSRGELVNICDNIEELSRKVSYVLDHVQEVYERDKVYRVPQVVAEEYIDGRQFSVDSYVDKDGNMTHTPVCKQIISHDLGFDDFQTYYSQYPSGVNDDEEKLIFDTVEKSVKSLKILSTTTHTEVKITSKGECKVIEVNVRPGGYRNEMLIESYGIDHFKNFTNSLFGKTIELQPSFRKYSACPQFWADEEGELAEVQNQDKIRKLQSFVKFAVSVRKGGDVGPVNKGYGRVAYAILAHENKEILDNDIKEIRNLVKICIC